MSRQRRLYAGLGLVLVATFLGTVAYMIIEDLGFLDALYLAIITISTVGFAEPSGGFSAAGQVATIILVIIGVGSVFYTATVGLEFLLEEVLAGRARTRFTGRRVGTMQDHVIVCGYGRVGRAVSKRLVAAGAEVVVIEIDPVKVESASRSSRVIIEGDATHYEMLDQAGIDRAGVLIAALADSDNLAIVLSARSIRPDIRIIARASEPDAEGRLVLAGADRVVAPISVGAERLAAMATDAELSEFIDIAVHNDLVNFKIEEVVLKPDSALKDRSLADSAIKERSGALILALRHRNGMVDVNPGGSSQLMAGDTLVAIGTGDQLATLQSMAGSAS
jgi:voltage-gated potassium channel